MLKPYGNRFIVQVQKEYIKEKGVQVMNDDGTPRFELDQTAKVIASNVPDVKKGMTVIVDYRGGMPIRKLENSKSVTVIFEADELNAIEI